MTTPKDFVSFNDVVSEHLISGQVQYLSRMLRLNSETGHNAVDREAMAFNLRRHNAGYPDLSRDLRVWNDHGGDMHDWYVHEDDVPTIVRRLQGYTTRRAC